MSEFKEKIKQLQEELSKTEASLQSDTSFSWSMIIAAVLPIVLFVALYFISPSFVKNKEGGKEVRSTGKVFAWTALVTIIIWACLYCYNLYFAPA